MSYCISRDLGVGMSIKFESDSSVVILVDSGYCLSESEILQYIGRGNRRVGVLVGHVICFSDDFLDARALERATKR
jgi:hypothetical protein